MKTVSSDKLSPLQQEVLVGTLLGDAHLRANRSKSKYQYVVLQSAYHKEYVFHLYEIFKNYTSTPPKEYTFKDKRFLGKIYTRWSFYTSYQECFRFYAHQFYTEKKQPSLLPICNTNQPLTLLSSKTVKCSKTSQTKQSFVRDLLLSYKSTEICQRKTEHPITDNIINEKEKILQTHRFAMFSHNICKRRKKVPKLIHRWLTPRAIAYWYMDDGAQKWKGRSLGVRFCTDNFTPSEIERLCKVLRETYLLKISLQKKGRKRIYVSSDSYIPLKDLIFAFLIPSMIYKFPLLQDIQKVNG